MMFLHQSARDCSSSAVAVSLIHGLLESTAAAPDPIQPANKSILWKGKTKNWSIWKGLSAGFLCHLGCFLAPFPISYIGLSNFK